MGEDLGKYHWEAVPIKGDGVKQLSKGEGLEHPAAEPPRPLLLSLATGFEPPDQTLFLAHVPGKLEGSENGKKRDRYA